jgi:putative phosphoribosyl transferase
MFRDRIDAGRQLASLLGDLAARSPIVAGLPRGGVVVAAEVARALRAPLDVIVVRKLGAPGHRELGIGAIAEHGVRVLNDDLVAMLGIGDREIDLIEQEEREELTRRITAYRRGREEAPVSGRPMVVIDDGLATGYTARAALLAARRRGAAPVVLAVPVGAPQTIRELRDFADEVVAVEQPRHLNAIGMWYHDFTQTSDDEVLHLLEEFAGLTTETTDVVVEAEGAELPGFLSVPSQPAGIVLFAHGSGSSRHSPRNQFVAKYLSDAGVATLLFDLLLPGEDRVFDIDLLARRLHTAVVWMSEHPDLADLPFGLFGASTGAAAALVAATEGRVPQAVVSRGGRPDLAGPALPKVSAPTLLIVGGADYTVLDLNRRAMAQMRCTTELEIIPGAGHLFEGPGELEMVAEAARRWFDRWLR